MRELTLKRGLDWRHYIILKWKEPRFGLTYEEMKKFRILKHSLFL